uniref:Uncharacterized protein n=1 Tax=Cajanus cajan TaxID=3821 RepID=A0A151S5Q1_CAJCA|nr:hypothetical protein KK1_028102 [Cajanus cajan]
MEDCSLLDLGAKGLKFTWYRRQLGSVIAKRLDRAMCDIPWQLTFPEAFVENLCRVYSDHCPILVRRNGRCSRWTDRPFHFQAAWATHRDFEPLVSNVWRRNSILGEWVVCNQEGSYSIQ